MMSNYSAKSLLDESENTDSSSASAMEWIARSYESMESWKKTGRELFFSVNGQSDVARNRLAGVIRKYFVDTRLEVENLQRWKNDSTERETVRIVPPKISASNSAYIDWALLADYVLLACSGVCEGLEEQNQIRATEFRQLLDSYNIRLAVYDARSIIRENPGISEEAVLAKLKLKHEKAAAAHVKEASRLERTNARHAAPSPPIEPPPMPSYISRYF